MVNLGWTIDEIGRNSVLFLFPEDWEKVESKPLVVVLVSRLCYQVCSTVSFNSELESSLTSHVNRWWRVVCVRKNWSFLLWFVSSYLCSQSSVCFTTIQRERLSHSSVMKPAKLNKPVRSLFRFYSFLVATTELNNIDIELGIWALVTKRSWIGNNLLQQNKRRRSNHHQFECSSLKL